MALARHSALSRQGHLLRAARSYKVASATASNQISRSPVAMELQSSVPHMQLLQALKAIVSTLTTDSHKGQAGKVGVMGGCREYSGAPFFAAMSSLRMGCDLAYVFCTPSAAPVIKGYSPELIVIPELRTVEDPLRPDHAFGDKMRPWLQRLSVLIIGPGLGDDPLVGDCMRQTVAMARELQLPLIIDGSGLNFVAETPDIVRGCSNCLLTPNIAEFGRLAKAAGVELDGSIGVQWQQQAQQLATALDGPLLLSKGPQDLITDGQQLLVVRADGSPRRCGGQGDILTGTTAAFMSWALAAQRKQQEQQQGAAAALPPLMLAAYGGCLTMRAAAVLTFRQLGRSMLAEDMLKQLGDPVLKHAVSGPISSVEATKDFLKTNEEAKKK
ncbi:HX dehydratase [Scenedesmus sp. NREL 46B-D3]|nr:HX dehydratase [Scenedesmus sp. NREL 46B-D3]